jgi:ubiquinone biosynthesis accessory factor UbiJ
MQFPAALFVAPINHLLRAAPWALEKMKPFVGKTAAFEVFPLTYRYTVQANGDVKSAMPGSVEDVHFRISPSLLPRILAGDEAAFKDVPIDGDSAFAQEISYLVRHLKWDVEEDLSKVVGDVAAHRTVSTAKNFTGWAKQSTENLAQNFKEYWTEEKPLVAKSIRLQEFAKQVDTLRDDVERLEKRIDKLSKSN